MTGGLGGVSEVHALNLPRTAALRAADEENGHTTHTACQERDSPQTHTHCIFHTNRCRIDMPPKENQKGR
jgi:hypothetical protein